MNLSQLWALQREREFNIYLKDITCLAFRLYFCILKAIISKTQCQRRALFLFLDNQEPTGGEN